ncbi:MAG: hypothetical protein DRN27_03145 [Thermoplasmata archaeon]|nr:MAG: hypothetical protein DRN27_03145 [Thermoplasmata archaeon]
MLQVNTILIIAGIFVLLFGLASLINPNLARFINCPGNAQIKAIMSSILGVVLILIGLLIL